MEQTTEPEKRWAENFEAFLKAILDSKVNIRCTLDGCIYKGDRKLKIQVIVDPKEVIRA